MIFDAALAMSLRAAALRPMVFVFEDLHWIDTSTEEYLGPRETENRPRST